MVLERPDTVGDNQSNDQVPYAPSFAQHSVSTTNMSTSDVHPEEADARVP